MTLIVLLYALLASTFVFAKYAVELASPIFLIGFRMTLAGSCLLGFLALFKKNRFVLKKEDLFLFARVAFFHVYLAFIAEFWSLQFLTSSKTNLIYSLTPFIAAALAYFLLKERLTTRKVIGMGIGVVGLIPIFLQNSGWDGSFSLPELVLLVAVTSASYAWFDIKKLIAKGYSLLMINGVAMFVGGLGAFITSWLCEDPVVKHWPSFLQYVLILVLLSNVIFYNLYGWLLKRYTITFLTFAGFLCPLFGTFLGWFVRGESLSWQYWFSLSAIFCALYLFYKEELKKSSLIIN